MGSCTKCTKYIHQHVGKETISLPEHVSGLSCLSEHSFQLLPLCLDGSVCGFNASILSNLERKQEGIQKDAVAHELGITCRPAGMSILDVHTSRSCKGLYLSTPSPTFPFSPHSLCVDLGRRDKHVSSKSHQKCQVLKA